MNSGRVVCNAPCLDPGAVEQNGPFDVSGRSVTDENDAGVQVCCLARPDGPDVAELSLVRQRQVTNETVATNGEMPLTVRHRARETRALGDEVAAEHAHLLFLPVDDLTAVER